MLATGLTSSAALRPLTVPSTIALLGQAGQPGHWPTSTHFRRQTNRQTNGYRHCISPHFSGSGLITSLFRQFGQPTWQCYTVNKKSNRETEPTGTVHNTCEYQCHRLHSKLIPITSQHMWVSVPQSAQQTDSHHVTIHVSISATVCTANWFPSRFLVRCHSWQINQLIS